MLNGGNPASGSYDLKFTLFGGSSGGSAVAGPVTNAPVGVSNGLFTVMLDFGNGVFTGANRWLEIGVRTNGSVAAYATLSQRQQLTPTPYAIYAGNASNVVASAVSAPQLNTVGGPSTGQVLSYNGTNLVWITAGGSSSSNAWQLGGNGGTSSANFLGTTDLQPLVLKGNNVRLLKLDPNSGAPNILGGAPGNFILAGVEGATLAGGGTFGTLGGAYTNTILANYSTIGGGLGNVIKAGAYESTIAGGNQNSVESNDSTVGGGIINHAKGSSSTVGGGYNNTASGGSATVPGGANNVAGADGSSVGGGVGNIIQTNAVSAAIGGGQYNSASASSATVSGGYQNTASGGSAFVGGGTANQAGANGASIVGGAGNTIPTNADYATIGGGSYHSATASSATVAGGYQNAATGGSSAVGGGSYNQAGGAASVISGGDENTIDASANFASIVGGKLNHVTSFGAGSVIGGGLDNIAGGSDSIVAGGSFNNASGPSSVIGGGGGNIASGNGSVVPGGFGNTAAGIGSMAAGGNASASHDGSFVWGDGNAGVFRSAAANTFNVRSTGGANFTLGSSSLVVTGQFIIANGLGSERAYMGGDGSGNDVQFGSLQPGVVNAAIYNAADGQFMNLYVKTLAITSDRNQKENFAPISAQDTLAKVAALPISRWNFKGDSAIPHIGPMAQDFYAAFGVGADNTHIATVDEDGVALAAIQGLNQKLEEQVKSNQAKDVEIQELKHRLERLEKLLPNSASEH